MELMTVKGLVQIEDAGLVDAHAHLWIEAPKCLDTITRPNLTNYSAVEAELHDFKMAGGTALIDCQPGGCGRDANILRRFSESTGLHVIATTGFHKREYYSPGSWLWLSSIEQALAYLIEELTYGIREANTNICATTIKIAFNGNPEGQERVLMEAAAEAARRCDALVLCHTEQGMHAEDIVRFFSNRKLPPNQLYICHMDKRADISLHRELAQEGVLLGYDTFARPKYDPERNVWRLLRTLVADGFHEYISIGLDMASATMWQHCGGQPGLCFLPNVIIPRLFAEGFPKSIVNQLTGSNIIRRLAKKSELKTSKP
ncbi:hypothetical protein ACFLTJ_01930 [Chloroflexota bacterium]